MYYFIQCIGIHAISGILSLIFQPQLFMENRQPSGFVGSFFRPKRKKIYILPVSMAVLLMPKQNKKQTCQLYQN